MKKIALIIILCMVSLLWAFSFDTATPPDTGESPSQGADRIREVKEAVQERCNVDHYWPLNGTEVDHADKGMHRKVEYQAVLATPTLAADQGMTYMQDVNGGSGAKVELFWQGEDDYQLQLTELNTAGNAAVLNITGTYENEVNYSNTGNAFNTDSLVCTDAGIFSLPDDTTDTTESNIKYNTTANTVQYYDDAGWETLAALTVLALDNAAYGSASCAGVDLSIDVGFAPDLVIGWNTTSANTGPGSVYIWQSTDASNTKNATTGVYTSGNITVSSTTITFPDGGNVNTSGKTMHYFALNFRASVQNPS